jgi:oxygen-independent coproporphyrinogen-3 oxidase
MLSLYLHIPFCSQVCNYCSFSVVEQQSAEIIQSYLTKLHAEIEHYGNLLPKAEIRSLYIGGGTPNLIGAEELIKLIDHCAQVFDCENIGELSLEFNPFPQEEIYTIVKKLNQHYHKRPRVRYSFGIQSFDNGVLANAGRPYTFPGMVDFLRGLRDLKQENNIFNFDFIAFGKFNQTKKGNTQLRTQPALDFFSEFSNSGFADSFSLYTLELFENQRRKKSESASLIEQ